MARESGSLRRGTASFAVVAHDFGDGLGHRCRKNSGRNNSGNNTRSSRGENATGEVAQQHRGLHVLGRQPPQRTRPVRGLFTRRKALATLACLVCGNGNSNGNSNNNSLLVNAGWVDPDSLPEVRAKEFEGRDFELVFSDEFNRDGRMFKDGSDPRWTAVNKNDYTNSALQFYSDEFVSYFWVCLFAVVLRDALHSSILVRMCGRDRLIERTMHVSVRYSRV